MEDAITALAVIALPIAGIAMLLLFGAMKPETPAQRRQRLRQDAIREAKQMNKITQDVYDRMSPGRKKRRGKRKKYRPSEYEIKRRMSDMEREYARR